mgnify:CR=1 FL=1
MSEADSYVHSVARMGTVIAIRLVGERALSQGKNVLDASVRRAVAWFDEVEATCSRFDGKSELRRLSGQTGTPVRVSAILFQAVQFALEVAEETNGAFDPTVGLTMEAHGFDRHYRTGQILRTPVVKESRSASYRDVRLDPAARSITLRRPLLLDLGAVAKGLAVDLAVRELQPFENFMVDAGGDLYLAGHNAEGEPWSVGIRHPRDPSALIDTLLVSDAAVCTSGDYERIEPERGGHHLMDPRGGRPATAVASATVIAPTAMMADALATAAFVLGPEDGLRFLERSEVDGLIVTPALEQFMTPGLHDE